MSIGSYWEESKPHRLLHRSYNKTIRRGRGTNEKSMAEMVNNGAAEILAAMGAKKAINAFNEQQSHAFDRYEVATSEIMP